MRSREIIYTHGRKTGTITCRQCGKSKTIDLAPFYPVRKEVKVKCPCGSAFDVFFENRRDRRLPVKLTAQLIDDHTGQAIADVTITSLSLSGISFIPSLTEHIQPGDRFRIAFSLDDKPRTPIEQTIIIRYVHADKTGAEFAEQGYIHDLDFYLMPLLDV
jgi:hypothetical protein